MRLGNSHCSGLQEDDDAVSRLIIALCTARTRLVGMIFDAAVSNCLYQENHIVRISIYGQRAQQVDQFKYLGSVISADGYISIEIQHRIALDKQAFMNEKKLFTGSLSIELKKENK